jgi:hypothetical protein
MRVCRRYAASHARLLARSGAAAFGRSFGRSTADDAASDRAGASGAPATFLSMRVCRRYAASHARLLARSGAAAFGRSTSGGAASGRTGSPMPLSAAFGRTAVLPNPASLAGDDASAARYTPQRTRASNDPLK